MIGSETIVAVATPAGRSVRAVIRVSGSATRKVLTSVLQETEGGRLERGVRVARLALGGGASVPVLVATFGGPASYTGEDCAEIVLCGNPFLVERVVASLSAIEGVRAAGPGEFTARAYLNDKLTLDQAEGIAATIAAESEEQLSAARGLAEGRTGDVYRAWAEELATLLALVEAGIDFSDQEDVVPISPADLARRLDMVARQLEVHLGAAAGREHADALPRVVFAGSANAGKSTLFNALLGRRRAVVSEVAGTTRDVLEEELDLSRDRGGAGRVMLVDVAGLDAAPGCLIEESAQLAAQRAIESADVILHCDPTARFAVGGKGWGASTIRVRTKSDLPGASDRNAIRVCALDGTNLATLKRAIADQACSARSAGLSSLLPRHRRAIAAAAARVGEAIDSFDSGSPRLANPELVADALRAGLDEIGELVGRISPDDVIGRVFATFCVGK